MKNNSRKKLFITLSSGILLSLATNQDVVFAAETELQNGNNIELINNAIVIEDITTYSMEGENKVEVQNLIDQIKITQIDEVTYRISGNTLENSEIILVIDDSEKFIAISDEEGNFEIEIKDLSKTSSVQAFIKDSEETTYFVEFPLANYIQQLEVIEQPKEDDLSDTEIQDIDEITPVKEPATEVPSEDEETIPVEEPATEVPSEGEETTPVEEPATEVPSEDEETTPVEEPIETPNKNKIEKPVEVKETPKVKSSTMQTFSTASTTSTRTAVNGVYTVKSGDSMGAISSSFGGSLSQLLAWNPQIKNANLISVGQKINVTKAAYEKYLADNKENNQAQPRPFKTNQEFIDFIAPYAMEIANAYGKDQLYASVMIAQAAHESAFGQSLLALPPYYNLFGIKGSYNGQTIPMGTWEDINGSIINITANFRDYPSYYESMMDYADLLRTGLTGSPNFYSKAWVKNTNSYKDATKFLTGTYATDTQYNIKVNNIIEQYNLTQYDTHIVETDLKNAVNVSYTALISLSGYTIDTKPWGTSGYQTVDKTNTYLGSDVQATKETTDGKYVLITYNGNVLGWVDKTALELSSKIGDVSSSVAVNYKATVSKTGYSIDTLPWGISGYKTVAKSTNYIGQEIEVVKETNNGSYSLISINGELLGWIDSNAISSYNIETNISSSHDTSYNAIVNETGFSIDTKPWGISGYHTIGHTSDYLGRTIEVVKETNNKNYVLISHDGKLLGWVDKKALRSYDVVTDITGSKSVSYSGIVLNASYSIDTKPWGTSDYQTIGKTTDYVGTPVKITREKGMYVLIETNGQSLGWVDKKAIQTYTVDTAISSSKNVSYNAVIAKNAYSIDTKPWGIKGYQTIAKTNNFVGKKVNVIKETGDGKYVLISLDGVTMGWVDKNSLNK